LGQLLWKAAPRLCRTPQKQQPGYRIALMQQPQRRLSSWRGFEPNAKSSLQLPEN
jgi:hypothetical protein